MTDTQTAPLTEAEIEALIEDDESCMITKALRQQRDEIASLRDALRPFADATADIDGAMPDRAEIWEHPCATSICAGDLRKAYAAWSKTAKAAGPSYEEPAAIKRDE